jgi:hypothetical protein
MVGPAPAAAFGVAGAVLLIGAGACRHADPLGRYNTTAGSINARLTRSAASRCSEAPVFDRHAKFYASAADIGPTRHHRLRPLNGTTTCSSAR